MEKKHVRINNNQHNRTNKQKLGTKLNEIKKASHYHKEVDELNAFTLTKVIELLVIPQEEIVDFFGRVYDYTIKHLQRSKRSGIFMEGC